MFKVVFKIGDSFRVIVLETDDYAFLGGVLKVRQAGDEILYYPLHLIRSPIVVTASE
jgi:hypothetical protein